MPIKKAQWKKNYFWGLYCTCIGPGWNISLRILLTVVLKFMLQAECEYSLLGPSGWLWNCIVCSRGGWKGGMGQFLCLQAKSAMDMVLILLNWSCKSRAEEMSCGSGVTNVTRWELSARDTAACMLPKALTFIFHFVQLMLDACSSWSLKSMLQVYFPASKMWANYSINDINVACCM